MTDDVELREQDKWLPIANVYRIMKNALPKNAKVSKEAKECVQECVSEFVSFITSEASEKCSAEKRKTVNGEDVLFAMASLGFENYAEVLKIYLTKYREYQNSRDRAKRAVGGPNGSLLNDDDVSDKTNVDNVSGLSDLGSLSSLSAQHGDNPAHMRADDIPGSVDMLRSEHSMHDHRRGGPGGENIVEDMPRRASQDENEPTADESDGGTPSNIVGYTEEPMYEDFQIE